MLERPFGKDIMVMDPAMADHGEAVNEFARMLGLPRAAGFSDRWRCTAMPF